MATASYVTSGLVFEPIEHKYFFRGNEIPSVTTIIKRSGLVDERFFNEEGRIRGTAAHEAIHLSVHNILDENNLHEIILPYFIQWKRFMAESKFLPEKKFCEGCYYNSVYRYAGKIDLFGKLNGRWALIEVKTGDDTTAHLQTAAYAAFEPLSLYTPRRYCLKLTPKKYELKQHASNQDFVSFLSLLRK